MKKTLTLLLLVVLLTTIFTACGSNVTPTKSTVRWWLGSHKNELGEWVNDTEEYTFNISLADFAPETTEGALFNSYTVNDKTYYRDTPIQAIGGSERINTFTDCDEIIPYDVVGTYTTKLSKQEDGNYKFTTVKEMWASYSVNYFTEDNLSKLDAAIVKDESALPDGVVLSASGDMVLYSIIKTEVVFHKDSQLPQSSYTDTEGYYFGKLHQGISNYRVETTYDNDKRTAKVVYTDRVDSSKNTTNEFKKLPTSFIDANQILLYVRSLEKQSDRFQDRPSVAVFDSFYGQVQTATFGFVYAQRVRLNNNGDDVNVALNAVSVAVGSNPLLVQYNLPDALETADKLQGSDKQEPMYTTVRFRSGYCSFELADYSVIPVEGGNIIDELIKLENPTTDK